MAITHAFIVSLVATATLFGGVLEGAATAGLEAGFARSQPSGSGVAVLNSSSDSEVDTADDDCPHGRDRPAGVQVHAAEHGPGLARYVVVRSAPVAPRHGRASSSIRGPPARG